MFEAIFNQVLVVHILASMVAVGTVTVTDYLHILGLKDPKLERRTLFVYPHLSKLISISLGAIYLTGVLLVLGKPELLQSTLFWIKMGLVVLVSINGYILHHSIFPKIEHGIRKKTYPERLLRIAALSGSFSVVTWYGIVVLAMTKNIGYTAGQFLVTYVFCLLVAYFLAIRIEHRRKI